MNPHTQILKIKVSDMALFDDRQDIANCSRIFYAYFEAIPSSKILNNVNIKTAMKWIEKIQSDQILKIHSRQFYNSASKKMEYSNINYILKDKILIKIENNGSVAILFTYESEKNATELSDKLKNFRKAHSSQLYTIVENGIGLSLFDIKSKKPKLSISENYNDDLFDLHDKLLKDLKKKDNSGLYLFQGIPGTGKSTYIRYLIHYMNKKVIFLPSKVAGNLDSPNLINILVAEPNSVLIIEDAENLLTSREKGNASSISMLLNLTDGLLGEALGIQIICTFNCSSINIDEALLRKGRLKALYEFKSLSIMKSIALLNKLGITEQVVKEPMALADIYNIHQQKFEYKAKTHNTIGFAPVIS